ncbi:MAG: methyltransferase domain-containing protein [Candidatus Hydrogenedentes bacterium]|nr:methyltransferase domain-containing protein [Candidatus Hydrogenedentota bacterium]
MDALYNARKEKQGRTFPRQFAPEWMDAPDLAPNRHEAALRGIQRVNFWSRAHRILWPPIRELAAEIGRPVRVLDLGCGAGDIAVRLWKTAQRVGVPWEIRGCDLSPYAVAHAQRRADQHGANIQFQILDVLHDPLPQNYDVLCASLFLHHFEWDIACDLLRRMADATQHQLLINDLVRSRSAYLFAVAGCSLLTRSDVVRHDGPQSVRSAFTVEEMTTLATTAGLKDAHITRHWPYRLRLLWRKQ